MGSIPCLRGLWRCSQEAGDRGATRAQIAADRVAVTTIGADDQANDIGLKDRKAHHTVDARWRQVAPSIFPAAAAQAATVSSLASS